MSLSLIDIYIVIGYLMLIAVVGLWVSRGQNTAAKFFIASKSIPGWVVAFTLMGTMISTGTFVGHPGTAFQKGLILLVPHLLLPAVLLVVAKFVVPFYRRVVHMSAYEYIGRRFGLAGRLYTSFGFLADRTFDIGVTLVTTAIAVNVLTGWDLRMVIVGLALFTATYTMLGGIKAVVWTDVAQGTFLIVGGLFVLLRLLFAPEAGAPFAVVGEAWRGGRLTLGSWDFSWASLFDAHTTTLWLFSVTYLSKWLRRYIADQHIVQRYLIARSDAEASRAVFTGALLCVPVFALFMFIGSCLYGFFSLAGVPGPELGDRVMPFFMSHYLPAGMLGVVVAAILAAAMSTTSSDLNSVATVVTTDFFGTAFPHASERARLLWGRVNIVIGGLIASGCALLLIPEKGLAPLMERAVTVAAILSGGTLGLFALGFLTRGATRRGCYVGIAACLGFMTWAILSQPAARVVDFGFNFPFNPILIGICGHLVLFTTGWIASRVLGGYCPADVEELTIYSPRFRESSATAAQRARSEAPNVLLVIVDDMGVHQLGANGSRFYETPEIDRLAAEGAHLTGAYAASPICSPARAALYTGIHPARLRLTNYIPGTEPEHPRLFTPAWQRFLPVEVDTLGDVLKRAGYATGHFGKWHFAPDYHYAPGRPTDPESQGFDDVLVTRKPAPDVDPERDPHSIERVTAAALNFMQRPRAEPFLCVIAHNALHRPEIAPAALVQKYAAKPDADNDANRPALGAMLESVDRSIGQLREGLRACGRDRDTLIVFVSDHGSFGRSATRKPLRGAKADLYEGGLRVPLIFHLPGRIRGGRCHGPVFGADVFNTIVDFCTGRATDGQDGISLRATVEQGRPSAPARAELCWHYPHYHHLGIAPCGAIRCGRWKLIEWFDRTIGGATDGPPYELYDLENDPGETTNLAAAEPARCADLARRLRTWRREVGAQEMTRNPRFQSAGDRNVAPPPPGDLTNPFNK